MFETTPPPPTLAQVIPDEEKRLRARWFVLVPLYLFVHMTILSIAMFCEMMFIETFYPEMLEELFNGTVALFLLIGLIGVDFVPQILKDLGSTAT